MDQCDLQHDRIKEKTNQSSISIKCIYLLYKIYLIKLTIYDIKLYKLEIKKENQYLTHKNNSLL